MAQTATEIVRTLLNDPTNPDVVRALVAPEATYVFPQLRQP